MNQTQYIITIVCLQTSARSIVLVYLIYIYKHMHLRARTRHRTLGHDVTRTHIETRAHTRTHAHTHTHTQCIPSLYSIGVPEAHCYTVTGGRYQAIYPKDIWELDDPFGRLVRRLFYGTEEIRMPQPSYDELVPNIGHMVWLGGGRMDYVFYLSLLSVLYVANVDKLYIHGDKEPAGENWQRVRLLQPFSL